MQEILFQIKPVMEEIFKVNPDTINFDTTAADIEKWDSLNNIKFLILLEKKFNIRFSGVEAGGLKNIGELTILISNKLKPVEWVNEITP